MLGPPGSVWKGKVLGMAPLHLDTRALAVDDRPSTSVHRILLRSWALSQSWPPSRLRSHPAPGTAPWLLDVWLAARWQSANGWCVFFQPN
ncbi:uncharacterized protein JN550_001705 [Neoarthrinium moseri]|uniref:uncharacterized protein n=1 Tax=Neoarthrinium moseri TaxID=1658444 RepID=UPI001FDCB17E|nr:uncharacterized protein JN550_001705 [Neoarthrinium moseri]KAI1876209.1 hypothetical protein JN550_001705 [Neoarthrinium moseri]